MTEENGNIAREATIAGAGSGTVIASLLSLMDEGAFKSISLILAPTLAVIVTALWSLIVYLISENIADWKINRQLKKAEKILEILRRSPNADPKALRSAEKQVETLKLATIQISQKRIEAVLGSQERSEKPAR